MNYVTDAIQKTFAFYLSEVVCIVVCIIIGIVHVYKNKPHSDRIGLITIALVVVLIISLFHSIIPFLSDVIRNDVITENGTYINSVGSDSKSSSSMSGLYSVELITESGELSLTTAPWCRERFPKGFFSVKAYYTKNSRILLYIETINE